jgi:hypothetical protein
MAALSEGSRQIGKLLEALFLLGPGEPPEFPLEVIVQP